MVPTMHMRTRTMVHIFCESQQHGGSDVKITSHFKIKTCLEAKSVIYELLMHVKRAQIRLITLTNKGKGDWNAKNAEQ